jgi:hypothetical protein
MDMPMNCEWYKEFERMKDQLIRALGLDAERTWAWDHLVSKVRSLASLGSLSLYSDLREALGAGGNDPHNLLKAARRLRDFRAKVSDALEMSDGFKTDDIVTADNLYTAVTGIDPCKPPKQYLVTRLCHELKCNGGNL